jgi:hypothetical protein
LQRTDYQGKSVSIVANSAALRGTKTSNRVKYFLLPTIKSGNSRHFILAALASFWLDFNEPLGIIPDRFVAFRFNPFQTVDLGILENQFSKNPAIVTQAWQEEYFHRLNLEKQNTGQKAIAHAF